MKNNTQKSNIVRDFFNKFYWRQHPEAALRYLPVVSQIKKAKLEDSKILEIGSGSLGIAPYFKRKIDALDVDFTGPQTDLLNQLKGNAWDLPFRKNAYDVSISVDVLEHIPPNLREKAIYEMIRVTKQLAIIVAPSGEDAQKQDKKLQQKWNQIFKEKNQFLEEHVKYGLPTSEEILVCIDKALRKLGKTAKTKSFANLNLTVRNFLMNTWITKNKLKYYLYLKGYLLLIPILRFCNFRKTYRRVFVIEFGSFK